MVSEPDKFNVCIDKWKRQLLDLTGRNRMLYYRPGSSTLSVYADELSVWNALTQTGHLDLDAANLVPPAAAPARASKEAELALSEVTPASSAETAASADPATRAQLGATSVERSAVQRTARSDDVAKQLDRATKQARQITQIARTFQEEQGVHVAYAVFGWMEWLDDSRPPLKGEETAALPGGKSVRRVRSPLLFVPVRLEPRPRGARLFLQADSHIEANLALEYYLKQTLGVAVDLEQDAELDPKAVQDAWRNAIEGREGWSVGPGRDVKVDTFSFKKIATLREMDRSRERIVSQPVLRALCGDPDALLKVPPIPVYADLDEMAAADDLHCVVPADASQIKAILAVHRGVNLVIQGPPGTGKSQTITNLLADAVAGGKRVLFVAEKRQAREVVVNNLERAGLGEAVLHITEEVTGQRGSSDAKRDIADQLAEILERGPGRYDPDEAARTRAGAVRRDLNDYARALHSPLGPWDRSAPYELLVRWARCAQSKAQTVPVKVPSVTKVDAAWLSQALQGAERVDDLGGRVLTSAQKDGWLDAKLEPWSEQKRADLETALTVLKEAPDRLKEATVVHGGGAGAFVAPTTLPGLRALHKTLDGVAAHLRAKRGFLHFLNPEFRRTKADMEAFDAIGARNPEAAGQTSASLGALLGDIQAKRAYLLEVFPPGTMGESIQGLAELARSRLASLHSAQDAAAVQARCTDAAPLGIRDVLIEMAKRWSPEVGIKEMLGPTLAKSWADEALRARPLLHREGSDLNRTVRTLMEEEENALGANRAGVLNAVAPLRPGNLQVAPKDSDLGNLRSQLQAKRRKPLRWLFGNASSVILRLKPCVVASPLAVAQFLRADAYEFDLVVFDEASQIPTADAVLPMSRAKQVVVVGDTQQMPPTTFFDRALSDQSDDDDTTYDSVLQEAGGLLPMLRLTWHYRSRDERLIAFSNQNFYNGALMTFPSSWAEHPDQGIRFVHLPDAVYGRGGSAANPDEARKVVELLAAELAADPGQEIGVTAMSVAQAVEVQDRIEEEAGRNPVLKRWLDAGGRARNLETIQGDEFDVSILSFGYGRDAAGNLQLNFGPLSQEDGYKRLNVAITRARRKMVVVSSIVAADINPGRVGQGGLIVKQFLDYAERGPVALVAKPEAATRDAYESPFEEDVAHGLRALDWSVDTQVGVNRFRIDLGVRHPAQEGRYLAGIECDGATYHAAETARDRDVGRQQVLERLGWRVHRVWSTDWFHDKQRVLSDLHAWLGRLRDGQEPDQGTTRSKSQPLGRFSPLASSKRVGVVPYRYEGPAPHPTVLNAVEGWRKWIAEKVRVEGPWRTTELGQALVAHGVSPDDASAIVATMAVGGLVTVDGDALWHRAADRRLVPVKVNDDRLAVRRDFVFYTDAELFRAMELACAEVGGAAKDAVPTLTARFLGFDRTTAEMRGRLDALLPAAVQQGYLATTGERVRPVGNVGKAII